MKVCGRNGKKGLNENQLMETFEKKYKNQFDRPRMFVYITVWFELCNFSFLRDVLILLVRIASLTSVEVDEVVF